MVGKNLFRALRGRLKSAVIWAMVPMAAISGRAVSGCVSPTGHFEQNCQCCNNSSQSAAETVCRCHCAKCGGATCCCRNKTLAGGDRAKQGGVQDGRCRAVGMYGITLAVNAAKVFQADDSHLSADLAALATATPSVARTTARCVTELNTGPPPDNLIVELNHRII